jgi:hypothetical protein
VHSDVLSRPADPGPPDAHLRYVPPPGVVDRDRHTPFLRAWATISTPVLSGWILVLLTLPTPVSLSGFATFLVVFAGVEAVARRRVRLLVTALAVVTAWVVVEAGLVFALLRNWQLVLAGVLALTAAGLLLLNLRELAGHSARQQPYESVPGLPPPPSGDADRSG